MAEFKDKFKTAMDNDLNSSLAVTALYDVLKAKTTDATKLALISDFDQVLSLSLIEKADQKRAELAKQSVTSSSNFSIISESGEDDPAVSEKIEARHVAKKSKNYALADQIRNELKAAGIELTDIPNGVRWKRI